MYKRQVNKTLYCVGVSPLVKDREAIFLADLEQIQVVDPAEVKLVADHSPFYKRALLYLESQWRQQIPTDSNLHIGHRAAMDLMPYQLDPAKLSLQRPRQRILIADTVGLGKTLEAGILMSELIARGKGKRILVVTVKSMMTQFQKEMWNRFTIPLVRLDSNRIQKIRANLPSNYNPFFYYNKTIISIDTLKRDVEYRTHLENAYWDIIVIDEAQNVAERGDHQAQRSRLAKLLADRSDTMIMLSATPHDGRAKSFASLMNMLDPTAIADPENYTPEDIKGLCIRRFKKDVKDQVSGSFLERKITLCQLSAVILVGMISDGDIERRVLFQGEGVDIISKQAFRNCKVEPSDSIRIVLIIDRAYNGKKFLAVGFQKRIRMQTVPKVAGCIQKPLKILIGVDNVCGRGSVGSACIGQLKVYLSVFRRNQNPGHIFF